MSSSEAVESISWCDSDRHSLFENYEDFNEWLEGESGQYFREEVQIDGLSQPSKALYASDREAYQQLFEAYRIERRSEVLSKTYLEGQFDDDHWAQRNHDRFELLISRLKNFTVVPFVGAGISVAGGFPTWKNHLREQGRTSGISNILIEDLLDTGDYEGVIQLIEENGRRDVFVNEIRDVFSRVGRLTNTAILLRELFRDTVITTNYDSLLEQAYDEGIGEEFEVISGTSALSTPAVDRTTIYKLHGNVSTPATCILGKNQYDDAYGYAGLDMKRAIPKLLEYHYKTSNLLFLGCSLNDDRTIEVFRSVKATMGESETPLHFSLEQAPEDETELADRNAYLAELGISAIWFERGQFDRIDEILLLARDELRYQGIQPAMPRNYTSESDSEGILGLIKKFIIWK